MRLSLCSALFSRAGGRARLAGGGVIGQRGREGARVDVPHRGRERERICDCDVCGSHCE